jgi:hypothetical protein
MAAPTSVIVNLYPKFMMLLPRLVLSEYSTQIVDMRVKEATTNDRSLTSASQRRGRFITGRSSLCLHLVRPSSDRPLAPNTWAAEILDGEMQLGPSGTQQTFWRGRLVLNNGGATWRQVDAAARGENRTRFHTETKSRARDAARRSGTRVWKYCSAQRRCQADSCERCIIRSMPGRHGRKPHNSSASHRHDRELQTVLVRRSFFKQGPPLQARRPARYLGATRQKLGAGANEVCAMSPLQGRGPKRPSTIRQP